VLLGSGEVLCLRHGYHRLPESPLRHWGGYGMPVREQLERLGVHDPELFELVESLRRGPGRAALSGLQAAHLRGPTRSSKETGASEGPP
jgi:hypothetical protein